MIYVVSPEFETWCNDNLQSPQWVKYNNGPLITAVLELTANSDIIFFHSNYGTYFIDHGDQYDIFSKEIKTLDIYVNPPDD